MSSEIHFLYKTPQILWIEMFLWGNLPFMPYILLSNFNNKKLLFIQIAPCLLYDIGIKQLHA